MSLIQSPSEESEARSPLRVPAESGQGRFVILLALFLSAAFSGVLLGTKSFFYRDFATYTYPLAYYLRESFWHGEMPFWNPLNHCGIPFLAQWNTLALYPPSLLYLMLPLPWSFNFFCLSHLLLGGVGMYVLARRWTGHDLAAGVAGVAFACNGLSLTSLMWSSVTASLGWMPWVVLFAERAWQEGGRRLFAAALLAALQVLSGTPEIILLTWLLLGALCGAQVLVARGHRVTVLTRFLAVGTLAAGLSAAQLLPSADLVAHSQRNAEFVKEQDAASRFWTMPLGAWANLLVPLFRCQQTPLGTLVHSQESWVASFSPGAGVVGLACLALLGVRRRRVWLLGAVAVLAWCVAWGPQGHIYSWLRAVFPPLGLMRYPVKFVVLVEFLVPVLAAFGVARWQQAGLEGNRRTWRLAWITAAVLLAITGLIVCTSAWRPVPGEDWRLTLRSGVQSAATLTLVLGAMWFATTSARTAFNRLLAPTLLALLALDGLSYSPALAPTVPARALDPKVVVLNPQPRAGQARALASLEALELAGANVQPDPFRQVALLRLGLMFDCNLLEEVPMASGFFPLNLREEAEVEALLLRRFPPHLADFLGVMQVTKPGTLTTWEARSSSLPLVTAGQAPAFLTPAQTWEALKTDAFLPERVVYLPPEAKASIQSQHATSVRIRRQNVGAGSIEIETEASEPAVVVVAQAYYHNWHAFVDGRETTLWRANYAFQAFEVPAGVHTTRLVYRDKAFFIGAIVSAFSLAIGVLGWLRGRVVPSRSSR